eukprot:722676_1
METLQLPGIKPAGGSRRSSARKSGRRKSARRSGRKSARRRSKSPGGRLSRRESHSALGETPVGVKALEGDAQIEILSKPFDLDTSSTDFDLKHCDVSESVAIDEVQCSTADLADALVTIQQNAKRTIDLSYEPCTFDDWRLVCNHLNNASKLVYLAVTNIPDSGFGTDHAIILSEALATNHSLERIDLDGNPIGDSGCVAMANALCVNRAVACFS